MKPRYEQQRLQSTVIIQAASYPLVHGVYCDHAGIEKDDAFADTHALQHPHLVYSQIAVDVPSATESL